MAQLTSGGPFPTPSSSDSRSRIIESLWAAPDLSRIELADSLMMDKSTMSRGVARLMDAGLIRETEAKESGPAGGRKRVGLEVCGDWGAWLGLEFQPDECSGVLVDFSGEQLERFRFTADISDSTFEEVLTRAGRLGLAIASEQGIPLRGTALGVPGPVRPGSGIVERSRPLGIESPSDLSLRGSRILSVPVSVDNDVDCGCRAETHFTTREASPNFLYLHAEARKAGLSLGLGTVIGGALHRGDHGASGEILSIYRSNGSDQLALDEKRVREAGRDRDSLIAVAGELAPQLALLANVLDIDRLILGGLFRKAFAAIEPVFSAALTRRRTYPDLADPQVLPSARGEESVAYGAAIRFTENLSNQEFWRNI